MQPEEIVAALADARGPRAGSDAERRTALRLAAELERAGRRTTVETVWLRPRWELAHALAAALGVTGSVVAVRAPAVGLALALLGLVALLLDRAGRAFPLRPLTPERATQNVIAPALADGGATRAAVPPLRVILTAHCDAPPAGLARRLARLRPFAPLAALPPGPYGWLTLALGAIAACAAVRLAGGSGTLLGALTLVPTLLALAAVALLVDAALAPPAPADGIGPAATIGALRALDAAPPERIALEAVLTGAGAGQALGFRSYLRRRRPAPERNLVIEVEGGPPDMPPTWWLLDRSLVPRSAARRLAALARTACEREPRLGATVRRGRAVCAALRARQRGIPALRLTAPRASDAVALIVALVEALDADRA